MFGEDPNRAIEFYLAMRDSKKERDVEEWTAEDAFDPKTAGRFVTKDSGERYVADSGYQRDTERGKPRFDLMLPLGVPYEHQMLTRIGDLLARGADKYESRNWERADQPEDLDRFRSSAYRHLIQWLTGDPDEDHGAAVIYNIIAHESTKWKLDNS